MESSGRPGTATGGDPPPQEAARGAHADARPQREASDPAADMQYGAIVTPMCVPGAPAARRVAQRDADANAAVHGASRLQGEQGEQRHASGRDATGTQPAAGSSFSFTQAAGSTLHGFSFGSTAAGRGGLAYLEGDRLVFPAGVHLAAYRVTNDEMLLTPLADTVRCARALALSNNRKYVAVVEEHEGAAVGHQTVSVYGLPSGKRVRQLPIEDALAGLPGAGLPGQVTVTSLSFSGNSKLLAVQLGEPTHQLVIFRWYLGKVVAVLSHEWPVLEAAFSPVDDTLLAAVGATSAAMHRLVADGGDPANAARSMPVATADGTRGAFTSMAWLMGNLLAIATLRGRIQVNQDNEVKAVLVPDAEDSINCVVAKGRGLIAAGRKAVLYFYDPVEASAKKGGSKDLFTLVRSLDAHLVGRGVVEVAVSPAEDALCVLSSAGEMLSCSLALVAEREEKDLEALLGRGWGMTGDAEHEPFRLVGGGVGGQAVVGMDATSQQPLLAVVTANKMVRVMNYATKRPVVVRQLVDDVLCLAMHPSGTMLLVGLHDKLALYSIALDDLQEVAEFGVKKCHLVRYSPGGSKFAAVGRTNTIVVHHAYRHTQLALLKGHVSAVTDLCFSSDERLLCSTGAGGALYFWDLATGARLADAEYVDKRCIFVAAEFANGSAAAGRAGAGAGSAGAVARTHDGRLQHVREGRVEFEVAGPQGGNASCMTLLGGERVLLVTDMQGAVMSYQWPGSFPAPPGMDKFLTPHRTRLHSTQAPISHMVAFPERGLLLTASPDGCVLLSSLALVLGGSLVEAGLSLPGTASAGGNAAPQVLVPVDRLSASVNRLVDLASMLGTIKTDAEYTAFRTSQALREAITRLEQELAAVRSQLADKERELAAVRDGAAGNEKAIVKMLENAHLAAAEELEVLFDRRLELEVEKARTAQMAADDKRFRLEEQMKRMQAAHQAELSAANERHAKAMVRMQQQVEEAKVSQREQDVFWDEYAAQAEVDYDVAEERLNARLTAAANAAEQREGVLRAELNLLKRASLRLKGEKALDAKRLEKLLKDNAKLQDSLDDSNETIAKLERELKEREAVLADNYDTLQVLRRKMQDLEKHKYVLAYKAEAYHAELEPRKAEVRSLREEVERHQAEMIERLAAATAQSRALSEKESYAKTLKNELASAKLRIAHQESLLKMFSSDVASVWNASDERGSAGVGQKSARQKGLEELYSKYVTSGGSALRSNAQVEAELTRHLHMSELRTQLMTHRLEEEQKQNKSDRRTLVHHNVQLLRELQVAVQDNREVGRKLAGTSSQLRELATRHRLLEEKLKSALAVGASPGLYPTLETVVPSVQGEEAEERTSVGRVDDGEAAGEGGAVAAEAAAEGGLPTTSSPAVGGSGRAVVAAGAHHQALVRASRPMSAMPSSSATASGGAYSYRTAGGPPGPGLLLRGSTSRALHELVAVERERIGGLLQELANSAAVVEKQQAALVQLHSALQAAMTAGLDINAHSPGYSTLAPSTPATTAAMQLHTARLRGPSYAKSPAVLASVLQPPPLPGSSANPNQTLDQHGEEDEQLITSEDAQAPGSPPGGAHNPSAGVGAASTAEPLRPREMSPDPVPLDPGPMAIPLQGPERAQATLRAGLLAGGPPIDAPTDAPTDANRRRGVTRPSSAAPASSAYRLSSPRGWAAGGGTGGTGAGSSGRSSPPTGARASSYSPGQHPPGAVSNYTALLNSSGPAAAHGAAAKRRPTTAGGVGLRSFINGSLKSWRET